MKLSRFSCCPTTSSSESEESETEASESGETERPMLLKPPRAEVVLEEAAAEAELLMELEALPDEAFARECIAGTPNWTFLDKFKNQTKVETGFEKKEKGGGGMR